MSVKIMMKEEKWQFYKDLTKLGIGTNLSKTSSEKAL
jgi:hypothetical protein